MPTASCSAFEAARLTRNERLLFEVGDTLALYTDGLPEASLNGERFGTGRIADAIGVNAHLGAQHVVNSLHDALLAFTHGRIPDDVAIVAVKIL